MLFINVKNLKNLKINLVFLKDLLLLVKEKPFHVSLRKVRLKNMLMNVYQNFLQNHH